MLIDDIKHYPNPSLSNLIFKVLDNVYYIDF